MGEIWRERGPDFERKFSEIFELFRFKTFGKLSPLFGGGFLRCDRAMKASARRSSMINMDTSLSTFSESFYRLFNNLNEDAEESLVSLLEEKVIPKNEKEEKMLREPQKRPKTLMVDRQYETRRSFHRKRKDNNENQFLKTYEYYESLHSPTVARRRSSSIAVPQPTHDPSPFGHSEKTPRSVSPRPSSARKNAITVSHQPTSQRNRTASMPAVSRAKVSA